jgi:hypothetical protein
MLKEGARVHFRQAWGGVCTSSCPQEPVLGLVLWDQSELHCVREPCSFPGLLLEPETQ